MVPQGRRPVLFLDVDGTLLPFGGDDWRGPSDTDADWHLSRLNPGLGRRLAALPCDLVWATTWGMTANAEVAPRLGLPPLPVVTWPEPSAARDQEDRWFGLHWKTRPLVEWAAGRAFIWVDDELTSADREWVDANSAGRGLLHHVEPSRGLAVDEVDVLLEWLLAH